MKNILCKSLLASTMLVTTSAYAVPIDLDFSNPYNVTFDTNIYWDTSHAATTDGVVRYTNVGMSGGSTIDARVTATVFGGYVPDWQAPNYANTSGAEPNGDHGFLYRRDSSIPIGQAVTGGLEFVFELFDGTGALSNTFTNPITADELNIIAYDVDGEPQQTENLRVFKADGLMSYITGTNPASLVATDMGASILFEGPGTNFSETDTTGAVLLNFANTDSFTLRFESSTIANNTAANNPIFSAIDGDLFIQFTGPPVIVPAPISVTLLGLGLVGLGLSRKRKIA
ncbi:hypothetical protein AKG98_2080 [Moritella sp. JT01]|uniref:hypothetical protein n=1 Tax=Moritella sp. JT01 TaxID=756698 RepID=UPI00079A13EC|nr:hypothetical protein [Moritella sp. JT01]KXO08029.1 hypothetical protein AKG98_2080 [Moritella sp. JT01]